MVKRGKNRFIKILDFLFIFLIIAILIVMFFRDGQTISDINCKDCNQTIECSDTCFSTCIKKGYDSITTGSYANESGALLCDCRCEHFLHSMMTKKECEAPLIPFGNLCCSDLDNSTICDKYEVIDLARIETESGFRWTSCSESCDDNNKCTIDECSKETDFKCKNIGITPCCGNKICEGSETCSDCGTDCGSCLSVDELKMFVNENFGEQEWKEINDSLNNELNYHSYKNGEVIILKILNAENFLRDYTQFINFDFVLPGTNNIPGDISKRKILEDYEHDLIFGKIKEKVGYLINNDKLFHHLNIYCSADTYIRLQPSWSYHEISTSDSYETYKNTGKFADDKNEMFPKALEILKKCVFGQEIPLIINLTNGISNSLGKEDIYIKKDDLYNKSITNYYPFNNEKFRVLKLKDNLSSSMFVGFQKNRFKDEVVWINQSIKLFEKDMKDYYELTGRKFISYSDYSSHELDETVIYDNNITMINSNMIESLYGIIYDYKITYKRTDNDGALINYVDENEVKPYIIHKLSLMCDPYTVIEIDAEDISTSDLGVKNIGPNIRNKVRENRGKLLSEAKKVLDACQ
ncbi:hypothetical protein HQ529_05905 [Candidatus Woesearchaeota archaeon]|nr:hypothetical protein [Candidatus Woesearchaeota archaeon]